MDKKKQIFIDRVDDCFNYFNDYRLEELKEDDRYYINAFMLYIEELESQVQLAHKQLKKANEILSS